MFKHIIAISALAISIPCLAADLTAMPQKKLSEVYGSFSATQNTLGTVASGSVEANFPLGHYFFLGPEVSYSTVRPKGGDRTDATSVGGVFGLNFDEGHIGPYVQVGALALTSDFSGWTLMPEAGIKIGTDNVAIRIGLAHPFSYNTNVGGQPTDLEGTIAKVGIGFRF